MAIKHALTGLSALVVLTACSATTRTAIDGPGRHAMPPVSDAGDPAGLEDLPPQDIALGECAVFFWGANPDRRFLAFENLTTGVARLLVDGQIREFISPGRSQSVVPGARYTRRFTNATPGLDIELAGEVGGGAADGLRIAPAIFQIGRETGERVVIPVVGHYACRVAR